jgi:hypothetical protein
MMGGITDTSFPFHYSDRGGEKQPERMFGKRGTEESMEQGKREMKASDFKDFDSWKRIEAKVKCINAITAYKLSIEKLRALGMKI